MNATTDPWLPLLGSLSLSRTEREVVKRFQADPLGRTFLPVADILRSHRLIDESLELLSQGVERHPGFTVARVVLTRELLQKGLVDSAWRVLEDSPVSLKDNILAQKLRLRLALLLSMESAARTTWQHMQLHQMVDAETKRLGDLLVGSGFDDARSWVLRDLTDRGIEPILPPTQGADTARPSVPESTAAGTLNSSSVDPSLVLAARKTDLDKRRGAASSSYLSEEQLEDDGTLAGFHVVPLDEIFHPGDDAEQPALNRRNGSGGIELDSTTLAEIYERQGHYSKALAVYRRLLRMTPHNDLLRRKVGELTKLDREQRDVDLTVDPALVDRMEEVEIIDRQVKFFNDLLGRLS